MNTPILLVHGFPLCREAWRAQIDALAATCRVVAPDLRGFGENPAKAEGVLTMDRFAGDLHALLKGLETGPAVVAGHSMGGYVALAFARLFPSMLKGLVLVATRAGPDTPEAAAGRRATAEKVRAEGTRIVVDAMASMMLAPGRTDPRVRGLMEGATKEGVIGALLGMAERADSAPMLGKISVPTLVVTGSADAIIPPAESEAMARAIPGAALEVIPGAGHLVAFEEPEAFNRVLEGWLALRGF